MTCTHEQINFDVFVKQFHTLLSGVNINRGGFLGVVFLSRALEFLLYTQDGLSPVLIVL